MHHPLYKYSLVLRGLPPPRCPTEDITHNRTHNSKESICLRLTFLDLEGAFDNVSFQATDCQHGHPTVTYKNIIKRIRRGCFQVSILSPDIWNLVEDDLLRFSAREIPGFFQAFADDLS